jgi:hypothetical protein
MIRSTLLTSVATVAVGRATAFTWAFDPPSVRDLWVFTQASVREGKLGGQ